MTCQAGRHGGGDDSDGGVHARQHGQEHQQRTGELAVVAIVLVEQQSRPEHAGGDEEGLEPGSGQPDDAARQDQRRDQGEQGADGHGARPGRVAEGQQQAPADRRQVRERDRATGWQ